MQPLIKKYGDKKIWVNWRLEWKTDSKGERKSTKVPYFSKDKLAKTTDPLTWKTLQQAEIDLDNGSNKFDGVGIVFPDALTLGIDIDHVIEDGKVKSPFAESILKLIKKANTYTEISQSGTGLHLYFDLEFPFIPLANKKAPFEIYTHGRYFTVTHNSYDKKPKEVRNIKTEEELIEILSQCGYPWGKNLETIDKIVEENTTIFTDNEILAKMFSSKNGNEIKSLYEGDLSLHNNDASSGDFSLLSHLAFWTSKNKEQMRRIWTSSPLGNREKTKKRKDYQDRSIQNAIDKCTNVYEPKKIIIERADFITVKKEVKDKDGNKKIIEVVVPCQENILIAFRTNPLLADKFRFNAWLNKKETTLYSESWRELKDNDYNLIKSILANTYMDMAFITASSVTVENATVQYCHENTIDPAKEYLTSLKWDGISRLSSWIKNTYNTEDYEDEYGIFGTQWLKGMVKRIIVPGCKFDNVLVLEGKQGIQKSTSLKVLVGNDWHVEITTNPSNKDFFMMMHGHMIVEFSEGETQERASMKLLKSIITTQIDVYRSPYGREMESFPRRCVFAMTTNDSKYLKDETGNRRWLPVKCKGNANLRWLKENREQLLAEAYHRAIILNEELYIGLDSETIKEMQNSRRIERVEEDAIMDWYDTLSYEEKMEGISIQDVFDGALKKDGVLFTQIHNHIIPPILINILKLEYKRKVVEKRKKSVYVPTEDTFTLFDKQSKKSW